MEFYYNRRLLLLNHDAPYSISIISNTEPLIAITNNTSSLSSSTTTTVFGNPLQEVPPPSIFPSNVVYFFVIIIAFLVLLICFILYFTGRDSSSHSSRHQERVDPTVIAKSLPAFSYRRDEKHEMDDCAICLEEFREGEKVKMIVYCKHVFHPQCIDTWIAKHVTCPICRSHKLCQGNGDGRQCREVGF
ncbi:hypothetical protein TanjilG_17111 [Lupinus angustifolius]|uniref:RING-type domain-containing protein n=1 Tax=Lupinus angustifolius TaxID=3871 RepID=A0A4P1R0Y3_LUPAN|nr:PREDICTED: RING-H2 finger protein ATL57-like [Lupinus angustifolius]OIV99301.1 hypothetical protein TanjilG_17111 [Lupinus angustifolius]